jgi:hypothetical protein
MPGKPTMIVREYVARLKETKKGKPSQIKDALDIYIEMWDRIIKKGTISEVDPIDVALSKIDKAGGLVEAAD